MDTVVRFLSLDPEDQGTQKCRLGPKTLALIGAKIGFPLLVSLQNGNCLCTAWPRRDLCDGYMQADFMCSTSYKPMTVFKDASISIKQISSLNSTKLRRISVKIVLKALEANQHSREALLHEIVRDLLRNVYVLPNYVISLSGDNSVVKIEVLEIDPLTSNAGLITANTSIHIKEVINHEQYKVTLQDAPHYKIAGMDEVYASIREILTLPLCYPKTIDKLGLLCPKGLLLVGPPGVGKTLLVKAVAREVGAYLVSLSGSSIHGSRPGESEENLRRIFEKAKEASNSCPSLLFIDEIDTLCPKRENSSNAPENRIVAQLLTLMDGIHSDNKMAIIGATSRPDAIDSALRRPGRFDREIIIGTPTCNQRKAILEVLISKMPIDDDVDVTALAEMTVGYVGADLSALCRDAAMRAVLQIGVGCPANMVNRKHFYEAFKRICPSSARSAIGQVEFKPVHWHQIGGLEKVKDQLKQCIEWPMKYPEAFCRMGLTLPKGVLLYGPSGCAKTTLVKAVATSCHCSFLAVSSADLFSPYVGDSEKILAQVFRQARASTPAIVFLDEIDAMVGCRSESRTGSGVQERILSVLLNELDGIGLKITERRENPKLLESNQEYSDQKLEFQEVVNKAVMIVAATNRPDTLDNALLRPGRLDKLLFIPPPDEKARLSILKICTASIPLADDVKLESLASGTALYSGADLKNLCKEAAMTALQESRLQASLVTQEHFQKSLASVKPSLNVKDLEVYKIVSGNTVNYESICPIRSLNVN
ncbi:hypothetical protein GDO86_006318 [Hymenochirus boettgeri]|uniref:AAA+ ATPase domain-containing protein n=1 Tax=Hymenochirus boettgeri TaxID=247094 RepID=A0A8T2J5M6_9PIPI|nr:hypothetical protein GDO86_006318 [Hymenochirus boettgeri]KAG8440520.1 hypothetical protein GDO86_006318 [Hymenochirus boettgeri]